MGILSRYIFRSLLMPFVLLLVAISGVVWLAQSLRIIDLIIDKGISLTDFFYIASLLIPSLVYIITPIALTIATVAVINRLRHDREIVVLKSIGLTDAQIIRPFFYFAAIICCFNYFISFYAMPRCYREFKDLSVYFRNNYASMLLQEDVFSTQVANLTIYIGRFLDDGKFEEIFINDRRDAQVEKTINANYGDLKISQNTGKLELSKGTIQEKNKVTGKVNIIHFEHYKMLMDMSVSHIEQLRGLSENEKYIHELLFPSQDIKRTEAWQWQVHGHQRLVWPAFNVSLCVMVAMILVSQPYSRRQRARENIAAATLTSAFIVLNMVVYSLAKNNIYFIPLMYVNLLVSFAMCSHRIFYVMHVIPSIFGKLIFSRKLT